MALRGNGQLQVERVAEQKLIERYQKIGSLVGFATLSELVFGKC